MKSRGSKILKISLVLMSCFQASRASATERYCRVTTIFDRGFLGDDLSVDANPDIVISADEVVIGKLLFSVEKGDSIKDVISVGVEKNIDVKQAGGDVTYFLNVNNLPSNKTGTLSGQVKGESASKIADLDCK